MRSLLLLPFLLELTVCITIPHQIPFLLPIDEENNTHDISSSSNKLLSKFKSSPTWTSRVRNKVVERIFGTPPGDKRHGQQHHFHIASSGQSGETKLKTSQFSIFANDVVLRFNISTVEEARALAEASEVMFMDVWSTTREHADIRMDRNTVCIALHS